MVLLLLTKQTEKESVTNPETTLTLSLQEEPVKWFE